MLTSPVASFLGTVPLVRNLLRAVFNLDWELLWPEIDALYEDVVLGEPIAYRKQLLHELDRTLEEYGEDAQLDQLLIAAESGMHTYSSLGIGPRAWLLDLRGRLRDSLFDGQTDR